MAKNSKKEIPITIWVEPELNQIMVVEADHRKVGLTTAIRDILWEYVNLYRKTTYYDVVFWLKQIFPEKELTEEQIDQAIKKVLKLESLDKEKLKINQEDIDKIKFFIDIGGVD